jgi:hypothetical protein
MPKGLVGNQGPAPELYQPHHRGWFRQRLIALYIGQTQIAEKLSARIAVLLKLYLYGKIERFSHPWSWS